MNLQVVGTGSSGNCYILKHNDSVVLLDAGFPLPQIYKALEYKIENVELCLISHAHIDHSAGAKGLLNQYVNTFMSEETANILSLTKSSYPTLLSRTTSKNWTVVSFPVEHDAPGTIGFLIGHKTSPNVICYITDAGYVKTSPQGVQTLIIECNYIDDLIDWTALTEQQIRLKQSHMSLARLVSYLQKIDQSKLKNIVLVHLSDTNSNEKRMVEELQAVTKAKIYAAKAGMEIEL